MASTLLVVPAAVAEDSAHKCKCFDPGSEDYHPCTVTITDDSIDIAFRKGEYAAQTIPLEAVSRVTEGTDRRIGAATIMVSFFITKKISEFTVEYEDPDEGPSLAAFNLKKKKATPIRRELLTKGNISVTPVD
ncbi:MAG: hypothetical protein AAFX85_01390 [Pseudomonadota bacterium]